MSDASIGQADLAFPLRGACDGGPGTLPRPLTSFVGRQRELAEAGRLLESSRLLTLTGPGGSGKTRSLHRACRGGGGRLSRWSVFRSAGVDHGPGASALVHRPGHRVAGFQGRPLMEHLASHLREKKFLIVLDNFEHLLAAAPVVAELLGGARDLRIIVSSRSPLRVSGEQECPVPPLALPDLQAPVSLASIGACESVRLFAERAAAAVPGFAVGEENAASVTQIARRLDGLPLAIELAAARVRLLPPEAILPRLEQSLSLLVGGSRDLPDRQQTLRRARSPGVDLLSAGARRLLAACSVFRGGASLEIIESSARPQPISACRCWTPSELVEHQLAASGAGHGGAALRDAGDHPRIRGRAPGRDAGGGQQGSPRRGVPGAGPGNPASADRTRIARAARPGARQHPRGDQYRQEDPAAALRLAAAMSGFWSVRGHYGKEGRLRELLVVAGENRARADALNAAGWLAHRSRRSPRCRPQADGEHRAQPRAE